jgi:hypothetical protein
MSAPKHLWEVPKSEQRKFRGAYKRGWNYSDNTDIPNHQGLDGNPDTGDLYWAWEDGYMDRATDREYGHRLTEHDHDNADECVAVDEKLHAEWLATQK